MASSEMIVLSSQPVERLRNVAAEAREERVDDRRLNGRFRSPVEGSVVPVPWWSVGSYQTHGSWVRLPGRGVWSTSLFVAVLRNTAQPTGG
jgi:hypothetical protein